MNKIKKLAGDGKHDKRFFTIYNSISNDSIWIIFLYALSYIDPFAL